MTTNDPTTMVPRNQCFPSAFGHKCSVTGRKYPKGALIYRTAEGRHALRNPADGTLPVDVEALLSGAREALTPLGMRITYSNYRADIFKDHDAESTVLVASWWPTTGKTTWAKWQKGDVCPSAEALAAWVANAPVLKCCTRPR